MYWETIINQNDPKDREIEKSWTNVFKLGETKLKDEIRRLKNEIQYLNIEIGSLTRRGKLNEIDIRTSDMIILRLRQENRDLKNRYGSGRHTNVNIDWVKKNLKFLIFACHPDRNNGRSEAQEVTKLLLDIRRSG